MKKYSKENLEALRQFKADLEACFARWERERMDQEFTAHLLRVGLRSQTLGNLLVCETDQELIGWLRGAEKELRKASAKIAKEK